MKTIYSLILTAFLFTSVNSVFSQGKGEAVQGILYFGLGTGISSFVGSDFGGRFGIRVSNPYRNDYYDGYYNSGYYHNYGYNNNYYDDPTGSYDPLNFDVVLGVKPTRNLAFEVQTTLLWHNHGRVDPQYDVTYNGNYIYTDKYDNSTLFAVPVMASVKYFPFPSVSSSFYVSGGFGFQYTRETLERVRTIEYNDNWGYNNYSDQYLIGEWQGEQWYKGVKIAAGVSYNLFHTLYGDVELAFTNFFPSVRNDSPLAMYRSPNISNITLGTKFYVKF